VKKILAAIALVLVIGAFVPFGSGMMMERSVRSTFKDLNRFFAAKGMGVSLEIVHYERSYLTSDIEWKIDLGVLKAFYRIDQVIFKDHARHGLAGIVSTTSLDKNPWYAAFVDEKLQGRDPIRIRTEYGLLGSIDTTVVLEGFSSVVENETIDIKPGSVAMATDRKLKHFTSKGSWQGLSVGAMLVIGEMSMASDLEMVSTVVWEGDAGFDCQEIKAQGKQHLLEIEGVKGKYRFDVADDQAKMSGRALFSMDKLTAKDLTVDGASVRIMANGLDVKGYEEFMQLYTQNLTRFFTQMAAVQNDSEKAKEVMKRQRTAFGIKMMTAYEKLLTAGLEFQVADMVVGLAEGEIKGGMTLRLLKDVTLLQLIPLVSRPELLFDMLYLKSDMRLPSGLAKDNSKLLTPLFPGMKTGLFVKNGETLVHAAETAGGKLTVNGEPVDLTLDRKGRL
jgi:uncharacterized protein YdgA (DUF945 family)